MGTFTDVYSSSVTWPVVVTYFIYSFHMVAFFVCGGYLFALSESKMELSVKAIVRKVIDKK